MDKQLVPRDPGRHAQTLFHYQCTHFCSKTPYPRRRLIVRIVNGVA